TPEDDKAAELYACTNRFYTLIPTDFGDAEKIPIIDNEELLKKKLAMLEALQDIEIATNMLIGEEEGDAIGQSYTKLNTSIVPLDPSSAEFCALKKYAEEGQDTDYFDFNLEVLEIF